MLSKQKRNKIKQTLKRNPFLFKIIRATYLLISSVYKEIKTFIRFSPRLVAMKLASNRKDIWEKSLPVQKVLRFNITENDLSIDSLLSMLHKEKLPFFEGGDSVFLPPETWGKTIFSSIQKKYPLNSGLKICKMPGDSTSYYMEDRAGRSVAQKLSFPHNKQILLFNYLYQQGVGPRLYDVIELVDDGGNIYTAYVVEYIESIPLQPNDLTEMVAKLKSLEKNDCLELISSAGWSGIDFEEPDCNANLRRSKDTNRVVYVDVHNFILKNYEQFLSELAKRTASTSHFGEKSLLLGGEFLYQEIPGVNLPGKRSPEARMIVMDRLLLESGLDLTGKVIFDVGCNLGLMGAQYLRRGARWLHGWDMLEVVVATDKVLSSIGCTRYSLSGGLLTPDVDLKAQLPLHLNEIPQEEIILNYLAIRGHIGWLNALKDLSWGYMLYESHQEDGPIQEYIDELNELIPVKLLTQGRVVDGTSSARDVAIIKRL